MASSLLTKETQNKFYRPVEDLEDRMRRLVLSTSLREGSTGIDESRISSQNLKT
jgi:hypothetical protein